MEANPDPKPIENIDSQLVDAQNYPQSYDHLQTSIPPNIINPVEIQNPGFQTQSNDINNVAFNSDAAQSLNISQFSQPQQVLQNVIQIPQANKELINSMPLCDSQSIPLSFTQILNTQPCLVQQVIQPQMQMIETQQFQSNMVINQQQMAYSQINSSNRHIPMDNPQFQVAMNQQVPVEQQQHFQVPVQIEQQYQVPVDTNLVIPDPLFVMQHDIQFVQQYTPPVSIQTTPAFAPPKSQFEQNKSMINDPLFEQPIIQEISTQIKDITADVYPQQVITGSPFEQAFERPFEAPFEQPIVNQAQQRSPPQNSPVYPSHSDNTDNESYDTTSLHSALSCKPDAAEIPDSSLRIEVKPLRIREHKCSTCTKSFSRKSDYTRHMKIHNGIRPFQCEICSKRFSQKSALTVHIRTHTGEKPYTCGYCTVRFADMSALKKHEQGTHEKKRYYCNEHGCTKSFSRKNALNSHLNGHSKKKKKIL
eukprot:NODE_152_length_16986_cov_0.478119.p4 type:complete len:477 gc:universal NODE_152_length_16986_cov_0.478119:16222-14792(-)